MKNFIRLINIAQNPYMGWAVLILSTALTLSAYWVAKNQIESKSQERFTFKAQELSDLIATRMSEYEQVLWGGVGLLNASSHVDRDEWKSYYDAIKVDQHLPGIQSFGLSIPLAEEDLEEHVQSVRGEGFVHYEIHPKDARSDYTSIIYIEPFNWRNQRAFGYDMWSENKRRQAMKRAKESGKASISESITLLQELSESRQKGFNMYLPVYKNKISTGENENNSSVFLGWIFASFRIHDLMAGILKENNADLHFEIYDGRYPVEKQRFYRSHPVSLPKVSTESYAVLDMPIVVQEQTWLIRFGIEKSAMLSKYEAEQPNTILMTGIVVDIFLFYVILSLIFINRHSKQRMQAVRAGAR